MLIDVRCSLWVAPFLRQVVLGYIRRLAKHEPMSEPSSNITAWFLLHFLGSKGILWLEVILCG